MLLSVGGAELELRLSSDGRHLAHSLPAALSPVPSAELRQRLAGTLAGLVEELTGRTHRFADVYVGHAGVSLTLLLLSRHDSSLCDERTCSLHLDRLEEKAFAPKVYTFLCGIGGFYALRAVFHPSDPSSVETLTRLGETQVLSLPREECELLYGRAGFLYCLLFVRRGLQLPQLFSDLVVALIQQIVEEGMRKNEPMIWSWHGKKYLGAAHGVAGVLYVLLCCSSKELDSIGNLHLWIETTLDVILDRYSVTDANSRNIVSTTDSRKNNLVHFCHGATGWIPLLLKMWAISRKEKYLHMALECGETVWKRGILVSKGPGICHGIGGSICALVDLFTATRQSIWLERSKYFAMILVQLLDELSPHADRPYSLMEGRAGALYSLGVVHALDAGRFPLGSGLSEDWQSCFPGLGLP